MSRAGLIAAVISTGLVVPAAAQNRLTLQEAEARTGPDFAPAHEGKEATLRGQVSRPPLWAVDTYYVAIQDQAGYGFLLQGPVSQFHSLEPGDWIDATGLIVRRAGMPTLVPREIRIVGHSAPPAPRVLNLKDLASPRYLGVLVRVEATVVQTGLNAGGDLLLLAERYSPRINAFLPKKRRHGNPNLRDYNEGDQVRVTGIATQYCTLPPYDSFFQILLADASGVSMIEKAWPISAGKLLIIVLLVMGTGGLWWMREHSASEFRHRIRMLNELAEQVIASSSSAEIARKLYRALAQLVNVSGLALFVQDRGTHQIDCLQAEGTARKWAAGSAPAPVAEAAAACFRNRLPLIISDTRRSPYFQNGTEDSGQTALPRSLMLVPMLAQGHLLGVFELEYSERLHCFNEDEQAAMQHLGNQVGTALRLLEQAAIREQLFQTHKRVSARSILAGIVDDLQAPLHSILNLTLAHGPSDEVQSTAIAAHAARASEIVSRLVSLTRPEDRDHTAVDVGAVLADLAVLREQHWRTKNITVRRQVQTPLPMWGSQSRLAHMFTNVFDAVEQSAGNLHEPREMLIAATSLGPKIIVQIALNGVAAADIDAVHEMAVENNAELRIAKNSAGQACLEIELPLADQEGAGDEDPAGRINAHPVTALVVDSETRHARQVVHALGARNHRAVPVASAEEAADLVSRVRFDVVLWDGTLELLHRGDLLERIRASCKLFVLMTDGYDAAAKAFEGTDAVVIGKPLRDADVGRICGMLHDRERRVVFTARA